MLTKDYDKLINDICLFNGDINFKNKLLELEVDESKQYEIIEYLKKLIPYKIEIDSILQYLKNNSDTFYYVCIANIYGVDEEYIKIISESNINSLDSIYSNKILLNTFINLIKTKKISILILEKLLKLKESDIKKLLKLFNQLPDEKFIIEMIDTIKFHKFINSYYISFLRNYGYNDEDIKSIFELPYVTQKRIIYSIRMGTPKTIILLLIKDNKFLDDILLRNIMLLHRGNIPIDNIIELINIIKVVDYDDAIKAIIYSFHNKKDIYDFFVNNYIDLIYKYNRKKSICEEIMLFFELANYLKNDSIKSYKTLYERFDDVPALITSDILYIINNCKSLLEQFDNFENTLMWLVNYKYYNINPYIIKNLIRYVSKTGYVALSDCFACNSEYINEFYLNIDNDLSLFLSDLLYDLEYKKITGKDLIILINERKLEYIELILKYIQSKYIQFDDIYELIKQDMPDETIESILNLNIKNKMRMEGIIR